MPIRVQCAGCKTALAVKDHLAGKRVRCPKCQQPLTVPSAASAAPLPVAKPPAKKPAAEPQPTAPTAADLEAEAAAALRDEPPAPPNGDAPAAPAAAPIRFACDYCEAQIEFAADLAGKRAQCPECGRIIKVPVPKTDKPKDWRTVEKTGPSAARANQPEKVDNAWGTESQSRVSQKSLLDAGAIARPKKPALGLEGWIVRGIKAALLALVIGGVGAAIWKWGNEAAARDSLAKFEQKCDPAWPGPIQGEFHIGLAELALKQPKKRELAREHFLKAWQKLPPASDVAGKLDRDAFLVRLARAQVDLGGDADAIQGLDRFEWGQEVFEEIDRTIKKIDSPEAKASAVREAAFALVEKKQPRVALSLVRSIAASTPPAKAVHLAILWSDPATQSEAKKLVPMPDAGKGPIDVVARSGYCEGFARQDKIDDAIKLALAPGETSHRFQALIAIADGLAVDPKSDKSAGIRQACDAAAKLLDRDPKAAIPPWLLVQHVRHTAKFDPEAAQGLLKKLPSGCKRRGQLEIALAGLAKASPPTDAASIRELDPEGPGRGLAWLSLARGNPAFTFAPDDPADEPLRGFFALPEVFRAGAGVEAAPK